MLIVTDGAVDIPDGLVGSPHLCRVAGSVWSDGEPFAGGEEELWDLLRRGHYPATSPPTINALVEVYRRPDVVVGVHVSAELSATVVRAREAAARAGTGAVVVDTRSLSVGAGLVVAAVHCAVAGGGAPEPIAALARSLPERLHTFALIQDIGSLRHSDRASLLPWDHLHHHRPLVIAARGRVLPLDQPRNRSAAVDQLVDHLRRSIGPGPSTWALGHGAASDLGQLVARLHDELGAPPAFVSRLDPTVGTHMGPEAVVVGAISGPVQL